MSQHIKPVWYIRLTQWEFWPFFMVYPFVMVYWLWCSLKARSLFYFTAANPNIETGGIFGESKSKILAQLPAHLQPAIVLVKARQNWHLTAQGIAQKGISYPLIAKPDVGCRGLLVQVIQNEAQLQAYLNKYPEMDVIVQAYVLHPIEAGIFCCVQPNSSSTTVVTSVTLKSFMSVTGDGKSNIRQLMANNIHTSMQLSRFETHYPDVLAQIPFDGQTILLEPVGNHCRGTKFINGNYLITPQMHHAFTQIMQTLPGMYYVRFDLRCPSLDDLAAGRNLQILEINGVGAEPAHIYQSGYPYWAAQRDLLYHWKLVYQIARHNHRSKAIPYYTFGELKKYWKTQKRYQSYADK
ncbi:MAG: hypothetical protein IPI59_10025 [Sphingobacteriales bacterium]|nr:hypothetical protein [Sphingobacteriales bacterium]MBP9142045.1 hypothetical protein [Chitinophagales bacterium]MDA0198163.1 hypothetical protein [Bacteroidota bacterium]MBK6889621.1 hypothetical protein [Sphingobacteriales bacterium]MBK7527868.1 hypothetical protein [Sphingobacteriales bacterium]